MPATAPMHLCGPAPGGVAPEDARRRDRTPRPMRARAAVSTPRARQSWPPRAASGASSSCRYAPTITSGTGRTGCATNSNSCSVDSSAHCRSSSTSRTGGARASRSRKRATASNRRSRAAPASPGPPGSTAAGASPAREQPGQLGGIGPDQLGDVTVIQGGQQRAQGYAPRPKRRCALGFSTCSPAEGQPTARGRDADQRGLTHARLAADQHQTRVAACGVLDRGQQPGQRPITADEEHTPDCARHHMRRPASTSATAGRIPAAATPFPAPSGSSSPIDPEDTP